MRAAEMCLEQQRSTRGSLRGLLLVLALILFTVAGGYAGHALWMQAKAQLAQYLIADAWQATLDTGKRVPPWHWADTWPVALMLTPQGHPLYVLAGLSGAALAFGPGMAVKGSALGETGTTIIAGHKNTHFTFLQDLRAGDVIRIQDRHGIWFRYRVTGSYIADSRRASLPQQQQRDELVLTTCYPFGPGHYDSPLRYVLQGVRL